MSASARSMVDAHERSLPADRRRRLGVHYTPPALARDLVDSALEALGRRPGRVCDPCCGGGAFLLAAADALHDRGMDPAAVVDDVLLGAEVAPDAARVARDALARWAEDRGAAPGSVRPRVVVADTLLEPPERWAGGGRDAARAGIDLVVGNPPFLGQLSADTARDEALRRSVAERFGDVPPYADTAALFLVAAVDLVAPGGVVCLLQPQSLLAARDTAAVRARLVEHAVLVGLWGSAEQLFDAAVRVCAPVLRRRGDAPGAGAPGAGAAAEPVVVRWGSDGAEVGRAPAPEGGASWGPLLAAAAGVPSVPLGSGRALAEVASATAGFRDEFYALASAAREEGDHGWAADAPKLVTVGMIDPGRLAWGRRRRPLAGRPVTAPRLDLGALEQGAPRVATWAGRRLRPKVLVASQTRVLEAVADPLGECVPVTPTVSVEPLDPGVDPFLLVAALLAPPVSARAAAVGFGSGLSSTAVRCSARSVLEVALPADPAAWDTGADLCRELASAPADRVPVLLRRLGSIMCRAHGVDPDHPVADWWYERAVRA